MCSRMNCVSGSSHPNSISFFCVSPHNDAETRAATYNDKISLHMAGFLSAWPVMSNPKALRGILKSLAQAVELSDYAGSNEGLCACELSDGHSCFSGSALLRSRPRLLLFP